MKNLLIVASLVAGLAGCGKSKSSDPVAQMKALSDQMCACKKDKDPKACSEKVKAAQEKWEDGLDESKITEEIGEKLEEADNGFSSCHREITGE